ncbi:MAG TPA: protease inhibitor I42 family protein [Armatimonadota bacterium]|nr:protease inhibitor I42 family protein [Armatimonadota bacterium]
MQTKVSVGKEDDGKSIRLGVGDLLELSLPETDAAASWHVEVDANVLAVVSSPTNTQTVWLLDEADQTRLWTFRAARTGYALLKLSYDSIENGAAVDHFALEVTVGDAPKPKPIRQPLPASQLIIVLFQSFLIAAAGALLSFRMATLTAQVLDLNDAVQVAQSDLLLALLGTVGLATVAGFLLVRIIALFTSRGR